MFPYHLNTQQKKGWRKDGPLGDTNVTGMICQVYPSQQHGFFSHVRSQQSSDIVDRADRRYMSEVQWKKIMSDLIESLGNYQQILHPSVTCIITDCICANLHPFKHVIYLLTILYIISTTFLNSLPFFLTHVIDFV